MSDSPAPPARAGGRFLIPLMAALTALAMATTSIYLPSLPHMAQDLSATIGEVQLTLTLYMAVYGLAQLVMGPLSDRYGRRPVMISGLALAVLASIGCAATYSVGMLLAARVLQGIGACVGVVTARAVIRDVYDRQGSARALSVMTMVVSLAPIAAPIIGGYIEIWAGWRVTFLLIATLTAVVMAAAIRLLPETNKNLQTQGSVIGSALVNYRQLLVIPGFWGYALTNVGLYVTFYSFVAGAPVAFIEVFQFSAERYGLIAAIPMVGFFMGSLLASRLGARLSLDRQIDLGTGAMGAAGLALLAVVAAGELGPATLIAPIFFWGIGMGVAQPNSLAGAVSINPRIAGSASALIGCIQFAGGGLGSLIVATLPKTEVTPFAVLLGVSAAATLLMWRLLAKAARRTAPSPNA